MRYRYTTKLYLLSMLLTVVAVIRRAPHFSFPPESVEVMPGGSANLTCVAVGSPMPYVRWRLGSVELTPPESIGRSVLVLTDIHESASYTCVAANEMGRIENTTNVTVKGTVSLACFCNRSETEKAVEKPKSVSNVWQGRSNQCASFPLSNSDSIIPVATTVSNA